MKKLSALMPAFFCILLFSSCQKEASPESNQSDQNSEEASINQITSTFKDIEFSKIILDIAEIADIENIRNGEIQFRKTCNESITTGNGNLNNLDQGTIFDYSWRYKFTCQDGLPTLITYSRSATGSVTNDLFDWTGKDDGQWTLDLTQSEYILNGTYTRDGITQSHHPQKDTYTDKLAIELTKLNIKKSHPYNIQGGTGRIIYDAQYSNGIQLSIPATIKFNGDNSATITINNVEHIVTWD